MSEFTLQATADTLEQTIRDRHLLDFPAVWANDEFVVPSYEGLSLPNVAHTIAQMMDAPFETPSPLQPVVWGGASPAGQVKRVVLFLMDGLGYNHLKRLMVADSTLRDTVQALTDGRGALPLTSIAPSTTAVALPSLWTGGTPGENGLTGTVTFLRDFSMPADMLRFRPIHGAHPVDTFFEWGLSVDDIIYLPDMGTHLKQAGITTHVMINRMLMGSGLSHIIHRGDIQPHTHTGYSDALPIFRQMLRETTGQRAYVYIYHGGVDTLAHRYGAHSDITAHEAITWLHNIADCLNDPQVQDGQTLFMLLADHGHDDITHWINLRTDEKAAPIRDAMAIGLMGDARFGHLYLRPGTVERVKAYIASEYGDCLTYVEVDAALEAGLFGDPQQVTQRARLRLGDLIVLPRRGYALTDPSVTDDSHMLSLHAGLTDLEMLVPFMWRVI